MTRHPTRHRFLEAARLLRAAEKQLDAVQREPASDAVKARADKLAERAAKVRMAVERGTPPARGRRVVVEKA